MIRWLSYLIAWILASVVFVPGAIFVLVLQDAPSVAFETAPTPEDVRATRSFVHGVQTAVEFGEGGGPFVTTEAQLNSVIRLGGRLLPGFRGHVTVLNDGVRGVAAIPVPYTGKTWWLNIAATAPEFDGQFTLSQVQFGGFELPPGSALELARRGANVIFGHDLGNLILSAATSMQVNQDTVSFDLGIHEVGQNGIMRAVFGALRGTDLPSRDDVDQYYLNFREALEAGKLPGEGSFLPHIVFMVDAAMKERVAAGGVNEFTAAIFALAEACGAGDFTRVIGGFAGVGSDFDHEWQTDCSKLTLNGRVDSRLHFVTSAAIQAASNLGFAVSVGEFKELYDSLSSSGFDFADIAANNSGIKLSNTFMATPAESWPGLLAVMIREDQIIVSFDGLPRAMSSEEFAAIYGDVESPSYSAMLTRIEAEIDQLPVHQKR